jgi:hypothetical protein
MSDKDDPIGELKIKLSKALKEHGDDESTVLNLIPAIENLLLDVKMPYIAQFISVAGVPLESLLGTTIFATIKIGGVVVDPKFDPPNPNSKVEIEGIYKKDDKDCKWKVETNTQTSQSPVPGKPGCFFHHYKTTVRLLGQCPGDANFVPICETSRTTMTGPHCLDPPKPPPQPNTESTVSQGKDQNGLPKEVVNQPDGTKITTELDKDSKLTVTVVYPDGTTVTMTAPPPPPQ